MDKRETLNKIKESLKSLMKFSDELKQVELSSFDLTDGTKITTSSTKLEIGSEVYALDDQGNQTPLNDGDYVLTDGRTITVKGNVVEAISESVSAMEDPQAQSETPAEGAMEQQLSDGMPDGQDPESPTEDEGEDMGPAHADVVARITDLEKQMEDILNIIKKLGSTQADVNEQMMSKLETLSTDNGGQPIKTSKKESVLDYKASSRSEFADELKDFLKKKQKNK